MTPLMIPKGGLSEPCHSLRPIALRPLVTPAELPPAEAFAPCLLGTEMLPPLERLLEEQTEHGNITGQQIQEQQRAS